jgi:YidC/Oxa1 family membrane protein insertase
VIADGVNPLSIFTIFTNPFQWILEHLTQTFSGVSLLSTIGSFGLAVIVLTLAIRAVLFPIFAWQLKNTRRIQSEQRRIAPQMQELRKKYKGQPQKLSAEMNKLYHEHGISPFSGLTGCLPLIVQMPVLIGLYNAIRQAAAPGHIAPGHTSFLWISDLSKSAHDSLGASGNWLQIFGHPGLLILPLIAAGLTFVQSRMMMPPLRPDMSDQERSMANITKQMSYIFPVMIILFSLNFPQGLALYWVTGTLFMVVQQYLVVGWGGVPVPAWIPGANRTTSLSYPAPALTSGKPADKNGQKDTKDAQVRGGAVSANGSKNLAPPQGAPDKPREPVRTGPSPNRSQSRQARARRKRRR